MGITEPREILTTLINNTYPTPEEIMAEPALEYPDVVIDLITIWKSNSFRQWESLPLNKRLKALRFLIKEIAALYNYPVNVEFSTCYSYNPRGKKAKLDKTRASIISALHELGHHLEGPSELKACRWSVHLFKKAFPKQFNNLVWKGHTLVRKPA